MAFTRSRGLFESTRVLFLPIHDIAPNPSVLTVFCSPFLSAVSPPVNTN